MILFRKRSTFAPHARFSCELWTINRWLRFTGWRLFIEIDDRIGPDRKPTRIGLGFFGWP